MSSSLAGFWVTLYGRIAVTPEALSEAMEYLIKNTFSKMSYLKRLSSEPLKEVQAVLRSNAIAKENLLFERGEGNAEAIEDLRSYLQLCAMKSQQVVLHDMTCWKSGIPCGLTVGLMRKCCCSWHGSSC